MADKKLSLAELMGNNGANAANGMLLSHLPSILGNAMPELPRNAVGRHRLIQALSQRFGPNFRTLPGIQGIIREFDSHVEIEKKIAQIRAIKPQYKAKGK